MNSGSKDDHYEKLGFWRGLALIPVLIAGVVVAVVGFLGIASLMAAGWIATTFENLTRKPKRPARNIDKEDLKRSSLPRPGGGLEGMLQWYHHSGHLDSYVPDPEAIGCIEQYLDTGGTPLVLTGDDGAGKSSLIAHYARRWSSSTRPVTERAIVHLGRTTSMETILRQIMAQLKMVVQGLPELPVSNSELVGQFSAWLEHAGRQTVVVLLIDNIDDLVQGPIPDPLWPWLPIPLPASVRLVATCKLGPAFFKLISSGWKSFKMRPFTASDARVVVERYFDHYCKSIDAKHIDALAAASEGNHPIYLQLLLNEIRVFGLFDHLDGFVGDLARVPDLKALYHRLFDRLEHDAALYGKVWDEMEINRVEPWWIYVILGYIAASPAPVNEAEERSLLRHMCAAMRIDIQEYIFDFSGLAQDLGIVEFYDGGLSISSPLVQKVLNQRPLCRKAASWYRDFFQPASSSSESTR